MNDFTFFFFVSYGYFDKAAQLWLSSDLEVGSGKIAVLHGKLTNHLLPWNLRKALAEEAPLSFGSICHLIIKHYICTLTSHSPRGHPWLSVGRDKVSYITELSRTPST